MDFSFFKTHLRTILIVVVLIVALIIAGNAVPEMSSLDKLSFGPNLPDCPTNLSGLFTARVMDEGKIASLVPLGNSNPPGHTFPVDHIYFQAGTTGEKLNVYAPGGGVVTRANEEVGYDASGNIIRSGTAITIGLCKGVSIVIATPGELAPNIKSALGRKTCKTADGKHNNEKTIKVCDYSLDYPVKAGDIIAITDGGNELPEVWALDKNKELSNDVDWERYDSPYYAYAFCFFDLYSGDLKAEYYKLFGSFDNDGRSAKTSKEKIIEFIPRTIEPVCGEVNQNIKGTVQGDWFGMPKGSSMEPGKNIGDLALIHDNVDPRIAKIVIAGNIASPGIVIFIPTHEGTINREFSEVRADNKIYCYQEDYQSGWSIGGKILLQLIDDNHMKIERQDGSCTTSESFVAPKIYDR